MPSSKSPEKIARIATLATLWFTVIMGAALVTFQIKPFWVDEWFVIYSLKTKSMAGIFGQLEFLQQFPRTYLALIKWFTSYFNYSYFSLRLPSYLVSISVILLCYNVMKKMYDKQVFSRYLFVMIIVSSFTFVKYFVEMKQYTMDIFMSVFVLWQLIELLKLRSDDPVDIKKYLILCISSFVVPFFSYTYLIAVVPMYVVVGLQALNILGDHIPSAEKRKIIMLQCLPLLIGGIGIILFYLLDARQLASDKIMYDRWSFLLIDNENKVLSFFKTFYKFFAQLGSGFVFENLFGILGVAAFFYGVVAAVRGLRNQNYSLTAQLRLYSCLVLVLTFALFLMKKLPLGTPRLNAYTMPSIAILIIWLINKISLSSRSKVQKMILPVILYAGVIGNIYSSYFNYFISPVYKKQMQIYVASESAIRRAGAQKMPVLITPGITFPYETAVIDAGKPDPAIWVLKTLPAYDMRQQPPVYAIKNTDSIGEVIAALPPGVKAVLVGDGINYHVINR